MSDIDKSGWGPGPWMNEPDRAEWKSETGFPCLMVRQPELGHWCGYVAVPPGHPWHGKHWSELSINAHGDITYAQKCQGEVCHVPAPGEPDDVWWVGFDCAHSGDYVPSSITYTARRPWETYRTADWVCRQTEELALMALKAMP